MDLSAIGRAFNFDPGFLDQVVDAQLQQRRQRRFGGGARRRGRGAGVGARGDALRAMRESRYLQAQPEPVLAWQEPLESASPSGQFGVGFTIDNEGGFSFGGPSSGPDMGYGEPGTGRPGNQFADASPVPELPQHDIRPGSDFGFAPPSGFPGSGTGFRNPRYYPPTPPPTFDFDLGDLGLGDFNFSGFTGFA